MPDDKVDHLIFHNGRWDIARHGDFGRMLGIAWANRRGEFVCEIKDAQHVFVLPTQYPGIAQIALDVVHAFEELSTLEFPGGTVQENATKQVLLIFVLMHWRMPEPGEVGNMGTKPLGAKAS